jgi:hypothetical protein
MNPGLGHTFDFFLSRRGSVAAKSFLLRADEVIE